MENSGEIIMYQPDETIRLEVRLGNDTVWLTQAQISELFQRDRSVISKHINNVFKERELEEKSNVQILHIPFSDKPVRLFSLDVIISVGYRVKSTRGTQFRIWANKVLKEYLLKGYSINQHINILERKVDDRFAEYDKHFEQIDQKIDFFVKTLLPPVEGIFYDGQIFDAYRFVINLIRSANKSITLIDNYIDESVLTMLSKREAHANAVIYTGQINRQLKLDLEKHNSQYPPITVNVIEKCHDRFLIIDDTDTYHIGASLKDLGKKLFAFSKLNMPVSVILRHLQFD